MNIYRLISIILIISSISCNSSKKISYSFFIAGHTYGKPGKTTLGLHQPFINKFELINGVKTMEFGVLTGDVVRIANKKSWDVVDSELKELKTLIHFSRGNHDGALSFFEKRYGKTVTSFQIKNDSHIILDSNISDWNITGEQLTFLKKSIKKKDVANIFIYVHHIIWWNKKEYYIPYMNSKDRMPEKLTFWKEIFPLLKKTKKPVYIFAGDVGAFDSKHKRFQSYSYIKKGNVSLITSGMGGGKKDNFIICDVLNNGSVQFRLINLNGEDINGLGKLEDYKSKYKLH